jgi:N-acetylglutamate synthase-like GNAT family acetyltransferase
MTEAEAKQIAELLNKRNQLARRYTGEDILKNAGNYEYELRNGRVAGCIERKKVQWYQWEIRHLSVLSEYEGKGVASIVYDRAEKAARTNGATVLQCTIREENARSVTFFQRHGFVKVGSFLYQATGNVVGVWQKIISKLPESLTQPMWTEQFLEYLRQSTVEESRFENAIALKQKYLPKRIYKYRSDNSSARENLKSSTIWLASPDSYNDPYDCLLRFSEPSMTAAFERGLIDPFVTGYKLEIPPDKIEEAKQSTTPLETLSRHITGVGKPGTNPSQMAEFFSKVVPKYVQSTVDVLQAVRTIMKVCSFSSVNDSILMWSHYGSNHQGFCVEYDLSKFDPQDAFLKNLYPVIYSHQLADLTPWAERLVTGKREELTTLFPLLGVIQKFEGWSYEQEWRYVSYQENPGPNRVRSMPLPSRVFIGAKAPSSTTAGLMAICQEKNIGLWQMHMSNDQYELLADPVDSLEQ